MVRATRDHNHNRMDQDGILEDRSKPNEHSVPQDEQRQQHHQQQRLSQLSMGEQSIGSQDSGYISIKDFAYEPSDPLYHGYTEDFEGLELEPETDISDVPYKEEAEHDDDQRYENRRQSIVLPTDYVINRLAVALYDFEPENDNELELQEGDVVFISYRHGQGWLVAENQNRTKTGLVPEEFVTYANEDDENWAEYEEGFQDTARPFYLTHFIIQGMQDPSSNSNTNSISNPNQQESIGNEEEHHEDSNGNGKIQQNDSNHEDNDQWEDIDHFQGDFADKLKISSSSNS
ncbi:ZYRO0F13882p [Zygosaccharomyces rouxii]|uniref:ZYRO0F13882p n=1 Tax=Zygosaccharomyces rouxii (strain ATCC 2623 / CBS 732 / NBRC 1130 / NCYC 568 / NRRL Y-229) TaxID=559307 RepID=C5DYL0_ZYGRC|nr:uncharacterized protein ZYRO0F13882g [Zygosaccharomyces rouxii]KAH9199628.1 hypothetical protein LQ764DRAFT_132983 [Zygosaccharomyces rouxii]CAR28871.1 ZYRO0F13882p [Zygosaccharomyces rouxii]